jgi:hypothetical protein
MRSRAHRLLRDAGADHLFVDVSGVLAWAWYIAKGSSRARRAIVHLRSVIQSERFSDSIDFHAAAIMQAT